MKNIKFFAAIMLLSSASFSSIAATTVSNHPSANAQKIGVVSVSGASNLTELEAKIARKAAASGASAYQITYAAGQNQLYGTAEIFN